VCLFLSLSAMSSVKRYCKKFKFYYHCIVVSITQLNSLCFSLFTSFFGLIFFLVQQSNKHARIFRAYASLYFGHRKFYFLFVHVHHIVLKTYCVGIYIFFL
jgi:hypothetical protein